MDVLDSAQKVREFLSEGEQKTADPFPARNQKTCLTGCWEGSSSSQTLYFCPVNQNKIYKKEEIMSYD